MHNRLLNILTIYFINCVRALKAAPMILNLTSVDNGASLHVDDPGELPNDDFICFGEKNSNVSIE